MHIRKFISFAFYYNLSRAAQWSGIPSVAQFPLATASSGMRLLVWVRPAGPIASPSRLDWDIFCIYLRTARQMS